MSYFPRMERYMRLNRHIKYNMLLKKHKTSFYLYLARTDYISFYKLTLTRVSLVIRCIKTSPTCVTSFSHTYITFFFARGPTRGSCYGKVKKREVRVCYKFTVPYAGTWATKIDVNSVQNHVVFLGEK